MRTVHYDYPYRMRIGHRSHCEIRIERKGRWIVFDPVTRPNPEDIVLITGAAPERLRGTYEAIEAGLKPTVVAPEPVLDWFSNTGRYDGGGVPREIDGVKIEGMSYAPVRGVRPLAHAVRLSFQGAGPLTVWRDLTGRLRLPSCEPQIFHLTFPDKSRLLHLDLSLHRDTDPGWVERAQSLFGNPEWLIVGCPFGEADAVARWIPSFGATHVLVAELVNTDRKEKNLPIELVTPLRDRLVTLGVEAHVFAGGAGYRFE